jgi:hypothetical protein
MPFVGSRSHLSVDSMTYGIPDQFDRRASILTTGNGRGACGDARWISRPTSTRPASASRAPKWSGQNRYDATGYFARLSVTLAAYSSATSSYDSWTLDFSLLTVL